MVREIKEGQWVRERKSLLKKKLSEKVDAGP